jgi:hypothetical protein
MAVIVSSKASHSTYDIDNAWSRLNDDKEENGNGKQISAEKNKNGKKVL